MIHKFSKIVLLFTLMIFFYSCSEDNDEIISDLPSDNPIETPTEDPLETLEAAEFYDVSYGSDELQSYDIYLPEGRSKNSTKVFVLVHGGAWVAGDKSELDALVGILKETYTDYAIVNLNYRLASVGVSPFPMQTDDISRVIDDLKAKESEYEISSNYAFIGTSAGAHLSMLYAYTLDEDDDVAMVCSIVGPTNLTDSNYVNNPDYAQFVLAVQLITGVSFSLNPGYYEDLSPYHVVDQNSPPTVMFYGGQDELIPNSQGTDMRDRLVELGVAHSFTFYPDEGHGWDGPNALDTQNKLIAFINQYF